MSLYEVIVDEQFLVDLTEARHADRQVAIQELIEDNLFGSFHESAPCRLVIRDKGQHTEFEWQDVQAQSLAQIPIPQGVLTYHFREYLGICQRMSELDLSASCPQLEAFDMAKKLAHDSAAGALKELCSLVEADHATCRRLFTLLLTLYVDTTKLGVLGHPSYR